MQPDSSHDPDHHRGNIKATRSSFRASNAGPYGRVYTRRLDPKLKNWENVLKNALCNLMEPIHLKQQSRKMFYGVSLEAYVERLHAQMLSLGYWPVSPETLVLYKGQHRTISKKKIARLQFDLSQARARLVELQSAIAVLEQKLKN